MVGGYRYDTSDNVGNDVRDPEPSRGPQADRYGRIEMGPGNMPYGTLSPFLGVPDIARRAQVREESLEPLAQDRRGDVRVRSRLVRIAGRAIRIVEHSFQRVVHSFQRKW